MNPAHASRLQRVQTQLRDFLDVCLRGVSTETIIEPPASGKWSALENLAHLGRYQEIFLDRVNRMLAETAPVFERYRAENDPEWQAWRDRPYKAVAADLALRREMLVAKLKPLSDSDFERTGVHPKFGEMPLALWLEFFLVHEGHHLYTVLHLLRKRD
jgi:uncharacterized damage-inducible protein DinB